MKKFGLAILATFLGFLTVFSLSGCAAEPTEESPLIGIWTWTENENWYYSFNPDGTGYRDTTVGVTEFTWSTRNGVITLRLIGTLPVGIIRNERWDYKIVGDLLTINSRQESGLTFSYKRAG